MAIMMIHIFILSITLPYLLAAPARTDKNTQSAQQQGPPKECEKPFGEGKLAEGPNPYNFTVTAKQRSETTNYKETFKGAPIDCKLAFEVLARSGIHRQCAWKLIDYFCEPVMFLASDYFR